VSAPRLRILGIADANASHTRKWANYFATRSHAMHLVSYAPPRSGGARLHPAVSVEDWTLPPLHVKRAAITLRALRRLRRIYRERQPDLVQVHFLGYGAWYAALAGGPPLAIWVMGGGDVVGTSWRPRNLQERILTPFALGRARLVTAWSRNLLGIVQPMLGKGVPSAVVVGGVDTNLFRPREDTATLRSLHGLRIDDFVILSSRLLWPRQNILTMVQSLPGILKYHPQARLVIVRYLPDPSYLAAVESEIDRLSLRASVRLVPEIPNEEMSAYFSLADCVVSIPDTDGTPMTIMEAAACGTPCLVADLPDYDPDVFVHEESALRVPREPGGLAATVGRLIDDPSLRQRLRAGGRRMVERHASYSIEMARLEEMYLHLLRDRSAFRASTKR
jgi:L-malate glycosyltransferase